MSHALGSDPGRVGGVVANTLITFRTCVVSTGDRYTGCVESRRGVDRLEVSTAGVTTGQLFDSGQELVEGGRQLVGTTQHREMAAVECDGVVRLEGTSHFGL